MLAQILSSDENDLDESQIMATIVILCPRMKLKRVKMMRMILIVTDSKQVHRLLLQCKYNLLGVDVVVKEVDMLLGLKTMVTKLRPAGQIRWFYVARCMLSIVFLSLKFSVLDSKLWSAGKIRSAKTSYPARGALYRKHIHSLWATVR